MPSTPQEAFERLVSAVYERRVLPLEGAGVSQGAEYEGAKRYRPTTHDLTRRLARHLCKRAQESEAVRRALEGALGEKFKGKKVMRLALPWLAEQVVQVDDEHSKLCQILKMERFRALRPTPAHRYLVFLAREGPSGRNGV